MSAVLVDLFRPYGIPPTPLHEAVQRAAMRAGWTPPWDHEEQKSKKRTAGKRSGQVRGGLAAMRRSLVNAARERLKPKYRNQPYSDESIDALDEEYRKLLAEGGDDPGLLVSLMLEVLSKADRQALIKMGRETLIKDLKLLGIRSRRGLHRPG